MITTLGLKAIADGDGFMKKYGYTHASGATVLLRHLNTYHLHNASFAGKPSAIERKEREAARVYDSLWRMQQRVLAHWEAVLLNYQLATNDVIIEEILRDWAQFLALYSVFMKKVRAVEKQVPELRKQLEGYHFVQFNVDEFNDVLSDLNQIGSAVAYPFVIHEQLAVELKKKFYAEHKSYRDYLKLREGV